MRKHTLFIVSILLVASVLLSACGSAPVTTALAQAEPTPEARRTLNVTGTGKTFLTPDIAYVSVGVHTENKDAGEAVADNNTQSQEVSNAIRALGIVAKDIQTTNFSIYPQQQFDDKGQLVGINYVVDNTVYVTVRDIAKVGDVLTAAVQAGANSVNNISFDVEDKTQALSEARKAAVANARAQAEELAEAAGVELGPIQTISVYGGAPMPVYEGKGIGGAVALDSSVPVSPGQLILSVDVNIVYSIE